VGQWPAHEKKEAQEPRIEPFLKYRRSVFFKKKKRFIFLLKQPGLMFLLTSTWPLKGDVVDLVFRLTLLRLDLQPRRRRRRADDARDQQQQSGQ
jgi:hypothetical protein